MVAISGYVTDSSATATAAVVAYPAMACFLTGAIVAFCSFFLSLIWTSMRIDAYLAYFSQLEKLKLAIDEHLRGVRGFAVLMSMIVALCQCAVLGISGFYFYGGGAVVVEALRETACLKSPASCTESPTPLFGPPDDGASLLPGIAATSTASPPPLLAPPFTTKVVMETLNGDTPQKMILPRTVTFEVTDGSTLEVRPESLPIALITVPPAEDSEKCDIELFRFLEGTGTIFVRNRHFDKLLKRNGALIGGSYLDIVINSTEFSVISKKEGQSNRYFRVTIPNEDGATGQVREATTAVVDLPFLSPSLYAPSGYVLLTRSLLSKPCVNLARRLGFGA